MATDLLDKSYIRFSEFILEKNKQCPIEDEVHKYYIARKLCAAVQELHEIGIMHGDLCGDNIIIKPNNSVNCDIKLIDFDNSEMIGKDWNPGRTEDFGHPEVEEVMTDVKHKSKLIAKAEYDLYPLAIHLHLLLRDTDQVMCSSIYSNDAYSLTYQDKVALIFEKSDQTTQIIQDLVEYKISAGEAAGRFNELIEQSDVF